MSKCRHFIGIQHTVCEAGVKMADMRDVSQPGMARWPCITFESGKAATTVCPKRELMTKEDFDKEKAEIVAAAEKFVTAVAAGKCPDCGAPIEPSVTTGRCKYASCGHRVGQVMTEEEP
jgi:hypothetical protein